MHDDEVDIDEDLARRLVATQFTKWSSLAIIPVLPRGTDNALYRLGEHMVLRLPRHAASVPSLVKEITHLPRLAALPFEVPRLLAVGTPTDAFPFPWAVLTWLEGEPATPERLRDDRATVAALSSLLKALRRMDGRGGPPPTGRGGPLAPRDTALRAAVEALRERIDRARVLALWKDALDAPTWADAPVWIHGDLDARNVLARNGRVAAVIDWGSCAIGDPACDVMVAWKMVPAELRAELRESLGVDAATWRRARGWALSQAMIALAYYTLDNNAVLVKEAWRWYRAVLEDDMR